MSRILVVEDESSIADAVLYALRNEGLQAEHCLLGLEALARLKSDSFDVVILDVGLPDVTGFEVCRLLRTFSDVPVIFLTARDAEIDRVVGLELGADDYVVKPFSPRQLVVRVLPRGGIAPGPETPVAGTGPGPFWQSRHGPLPVCAFADRAIAPSNLLSLQNAGARMEVI